MKLFKAILESGPYAHYNRTAYIVAEDYGDAETSLTAQSDLWESSFGKRIARLDEIDNSVMLSDAIIQTDNPNTHK